PTWTRYPQMGAMWVTKARAFLRTVPGGYEKRRTWANPPGPRWGTAEGVPRALDGTGQLSIARPERPMCRMVGDNEGRPGTVEGRGPWGPVGDREGLLKIDAEVMIGKENFYAVECNGASEGTEVVPSSNGDLD